MQTFDVAVIGAGIVGLATAWTLSRAVPKLRIVVLDKESTIAWHQSGRNSGVLHSGIYYRPGSLRALTCKSGRTMMVEFCRSRHLPLELCGKLIVAVNAHEIQALRQIRDNGIRNGVEIELLDAKQLTEAEPHARGVEALYVASAGITDYRTVSTQLVSELLGAGQKLFLQREVVAATESRLGIRLTTSRETLDVGGVINCSGLHSDRVARLLGQDSPVTIIPFRGDFYALRGRATELVRGLIYPVPSPNLPFLGVHLTRCIDGSVHCGPNAVLALGREAYGRLSVNFQDGLEMLSEPGFWQLANRHWRAALGEWTRSVSRRSFALAARRLVPELSAAQLAPAASGIRAQAVSADGHLVDDFLIAHTENVVSVCNAPSPAATASFAIAEAIAERFLHPSSSDQVA